MHCLSFCIAHSIDLKRLENSLLKKKLQVQLQQDVLHVSDPQQQHDIFYFSNGSFISWNVNKSTVDHYRALAKPFCQKLLSKPQSDEFIYKLADHVAIKPHGHFNVEIITLDTDDSDTKLALSYGLSQSIKLKMYEQMTERLITKNTPLIEQLSQKGKIHFSRKSIMQIIGKIIEAKSLINLKSSFSYQPTFFWQHPNLENYYSTIADYLDIPERIDAVNKQLDTLDEIFSMLNSYLENRHSHFLEVIIIVLLAAEIVFSVLNLHF